METTVQLTETEEMRKFIDKLKEETPLEGTRKFIDNMSERDIQIMFIYDTKLKISIDNLIEYMDKRFDRIEKILSQLVRK